MNSCKEFQAKYQQQKKLGQGGYGSVFAGYRKSDNLPVAIKYIPKDKVCKHKDENGDEISTEVAVMLKLVATRGSVSLLDWYDLEWKLILVLERPVLAQDLHTYITMKGGRLQEEETKIIMKQLVDAALELQDRNIFHQDIKVENILIETNSDVPHLRLIDFGLSCFIKKGASCRVFKGTPEHTPPEWYSDGKYRAGPTTVWQLGVVLFETIQKKEDFVTNKFLQNSLKINRKLPEECKDFLRSCLNMDPKLRPTLEQLRCHPWLS